MPAIAELCDRTEERPTQRIEVDGLGPHVVQVVLPTLPTELLAAMARVTGQPAPKLQQHAAHSHRRVTVEPEAPSMPTAATQSGDPSGG